MLGLAVAFHRGQGLFDIDFTGGVSVQAVFRQERGHRREIRKTLTILPDLAVSDVRPEGERRTDAGSSSTPRRPRRFEQVEKDVKDAFGDKLVVEHDDSPPNGLDRSGPAA